MSISLPGTIRIVAGAHRGRRLSVPKGPEVRPTSEKVREAIFDVLGPVDGLRVVDLFAGSGALGLEALSRGACSCVFVENDRNVAEVLRANVALLGLEWASEVMVAQYLPAARSLAARPKGFELFFVDPPYRMLAEVEDALRPLASGLLAADGLMVVEGPRSQDATFGLPVVFERHYGETRVTMVRPQRSDS